MDQLFDKNGNLNIELIKETLEIYYHSTGIPIFAIDEVGEIICKIGEESIFCTLFQKTLEGSCPCSQTHLFASKQSQYIGEGYIFSCPASLIHFACPLVKDTLFKGALVAGPVLIYPPDEFMAEDIIKKYNLSSLSVGTVMNYLMKVKLASPENVRFLNKLLFIVVSNLLEDDKFILKERNKLMDQQSKISESIHFIKEREHLSSYYPYQKERDLFVKVRNGDVIGAKTILNELLGHVFFISGGNNEIIKARILELCSVLSRAAVQGGASLDKIFGINYKFIRKLSKIDNIYDLSFWTLDILDRFTESVFELSKTRNPDIIKTSLQYINKNYINKITLPDVAKYVHLNPSYFSNLFKNEVRTSFSAYLNTVRIGEAKKHLRETDQSILDIALTVGFDSQSYFSKVFKRVTGLTPRQYRNQ